MNKTESKNAGAEDAGMRPCGAFSSDDDFEEALNRCIGLRPDGTVPVRYARLRRSSRCATSDASRRVADALRRLSGGGGAEAV